MSCCVSTCCNDVKNLRIVDVDAARQSVYFFKFVAEGRAVSSSWLACTASKDVKMSPWALCGGVFLCLVQDFLRPCAFASTRPRQEYRKKPLRACHAVTLRLTIHAKPFCLCIVAPALGLENQLQCEDWLGNGFTTSFFYSFYGRTCYHF